MPIVALAAIAFQASTTPPTLVERWRAVIVEEFKPARIPVKNSMKPLPARVPSAKNDTYLFFEVVGREPAPSHESADDQLLRDLARYYIQHSDDVAGLTKSAHDRYGPHVAFQGPKFAKAWEIYTIVPKTASGGLRPDDVAFALTPSELQALAHLYTATMVGVPGRERYPCCSGPILVLSCKPSRASVLALLDIVDALDRAKVYDRITPSFIEQHVQQMFDQPTANWSQYWNSIDMERLSAKQREICMFRESYNESILRTRASEKARMEKQRIELDRKAQEDREKAKRSNGQQP